MLQQDRPDDYVIATGRTTSIRELCRIAFAHAGLDWQAHVRVADRLLRPAEVDVLLGDSTKARTRLGWMPEVGLEAMVAEMVDADLARHRARAVAGG
jgi:GDPmannose 4,6-dehydratase